MMKGIAQVISVISILIGIADATEEALSSKMLSKPNNRKNYKLNPLKHEIEDALHKSSMILVKNITEHGKATTLVKSDIESILIPNRTFSYETPLFVCLLDEKISKRTQNPTAGRDTKKPYRILMQTMISNIAYEKLKSIFSTKEEIEQARNEISSSIKYLEALANIVVYDLYISIIDSGHQVHTASSIFIPRLMKISNNLCKDDLYTMGLDKELIKLIWDMKTDKMSKMNQIIAEKKQLVEQKDFITMTECFEKHKSIFTFKGSYSIITCFLDSLKQIFTKNSRGIRTINIKKVNMHTVQELYNMILTLKELAQDMVYLVEHDERWESPVIVAKSSMSDLLNFDVIQIIYRSIDDKIYEKLVKNTPENIDAILSAKKISDILKMRNYLNDSKNSSASRETSI